MAGSASLCPKFHKAIELVGGRWTGAVLQILLSGRSRFTDIRGAIPQISDRMLSERLHELETEGLLLRHVIPDTPVRVEYELTQKGRELQSSLSAVAKWADRWLDEMPDDPAPAKSVALSAGAASGRKRGRKS